MIVKIRVAADGRLLVTCDVDRWRPQAILTAVKIGRKEDNCSANQELKVMCQWIPLHGRSNVRGILTCAETSKSKKNTLARKLTMMLMLVAKFLAMLSA